MAKGQTDRVELFSRRSIFGRRQHYWRLVAENNKIVAIAGEGFASMRNARENFELVCTMLYPDTKLSSIPIERP